ncbi:S-layer homology domain-containing protein [Lysinibacillus sp. CNPSo 3705]|uniref:S-layer homology domain-containing protein n=1 Tax=Lysinibacillus sp. CNPSo 3705 TaxID=3028148 RepID=UPI002363AAF0|nr:S-layer homology domain-containing protein [Lysinibacillus sp. CNPSo 3705]MDD1504883.1 S-layer homology domain-containing protein [Lysinibacillus sp. CNPSo 3705]
MQTVKKEVKTIVEAVCIPNLKSEDKHIGLPEETADEKRWRECGLVKTETSNFRSYWRQKKHNLFCLDKVKNKLLKGVVPQNKFLLGAMAMGVATASVVVPVITETAHADYKTPFKDIPKTHVYYDILHQMRDQGIITGYGDGTFKPDVKISRQHAAVLIERATSLTSKVPFEQYNDIPKTHPYFDAIQRLQQTGVIKSNAKGNFNPTKNLTRGEMALILANAFKLEAKGKHPFKDVSQTTEEGKAIAALYEAEITTGYDATTFKPNVPLSRAHYAVFLYRALNYEKTAGKPIEKDIPKLNMDMSLDDFQKVVINDKSLYNVAPDEKVTEFAFNDPRFKKLLIEGQRYVKQTNFKYKEAGAFIHLQEPNWINTLPPGYLSTQIGILLNSKTKDIKFSFDYTSENTVNLTLQLFNLAYPELSSLESKIKESAKEAREAYAKEKDIPAGERDFQGNITIEYIGDFKVRFGTNYRLEYFWIEVQKNK